MFELNWDGIEASGPDYLYLAQEMRHECFPVERIVDALEALNRVWDADAVLKTYREGRADVDA